MSLILCGLQTACEAAQSKSLRYLGTSIGYSLH